MVLMGFVQNTMKQLIMSFVAFAFYTLLCVNVVKSFPDSRTTLAYSDCGSQYILDYFMIENCTTSPCEIAYDKSYRMIIHLTATHDSVSFTQTAFVKLFGVINEPVDVTPAQPCSAIPCPLSSHADQDFQVIINVPGRSIPIPTSSELTWQITDNTGQIVICMKTSIYLIVNS